MASKAVLASLVEKQLSRFLQPQPFYTFLDNSWLPQKRTVAPPGSNTTQSLHLITWNIDFMASQPRARMASALSCLENLVSDIPTSSAVIIFLQEMMESTAVGAGNDFTQLCTAPWIRERFHMTDIDMSTATAHYGQVTLIDRRLSIVQVSRLQFVSEFGRDAVLVDIPLASDESKILRLCNVHMDSMTGTLRPVQWKGVAKVLQNEEEGVAVSILAGDCNANQPRDSTEPQKNGFTDAYLELGGVEGDPEGATWGFQSKSGKKWGLSRMDKVVYWGNADARRLERIGVGLEVGDKKALGRLEENFELPFVTDHYGLHCEFVLEDGLSMLGDDDIVLGAAKTPNCTIL